MVPRDLRLEVDERVLADGAIHTEVNLDQVEAAARELLARGCEAVCVFFVNAYANPANEARAVARVREIWPNGHVTAATEVLPEIREFERCSTATLNAALQPVVGSYLTRLQQDLRGHGFDGELLVVQSNGGVMSRETACDVPVRTALSGPAAGVIACAAIARAAGLPDVVTGDMGGTSFDVSLVAGGEVSLAAQTAIEFGMVVRAPMIQIETIGAGGGSIASVDAGGLLQVGPESAGSNPGRPAMAGATHGPPSPTPMCCSAASRPTGRWAADCWRGWTPNARARPSTSTWAGRWAWTRRRRPRPSSRWPTPRWPARSAWCRSSAATIRASSPTCPSAAAARCTSAR